MKRSDYSGNDTKLYTFLGDEGKVQFCKEQNYIGTWNVRSIIKVNWIWTSLNFNMLGISELKWMRMGKFNSDDHYIYYYGQNSLRRNGVTSIGNKSPKCSTWVQPQKWQNDLCLLPRQNIQHLSNPSNVPQTLMSKKMKLVHSMRTIIHFRTHFPENVLSITGDWKSKEVSQEIPEVIGNFDFGV